MSDNQSFSDQFSELEKIVEWFDSDDIELDKALKQFDKGMTLSKKLKDQLAKAENRIKEIKAQHQE